MMAELKDTTEQATVDGVATEEPVAKNKVQKRIDRLTAQRYEADAKAKASEDKVHKLETRLNALENPVGDRPSIENYDDQAAYEDALFEWRDRVVKKEPVVQEPVKDHFQEKMMDAISKYPDYREVAQNPNLEITQSMAQIMSDMDVGADVLYELGKTPQEAMRISKLPLAQQAVELSKVEDAIMFPQKTVSQAPDPVESLSGDDTPVKSESDMTTEEWIAAKNKQEYGF